MVSSVCLGGQAGGAGPVGDDEHAGLGGAAERDDEGGAVAGVAGEEGLVGGEVRARVGLTAAIGIAGEGALGRNAQPEQVLGVGAVGHRHDQPLLGRVRVRQQQEHDVGGGELAGAGGDEPQGLVRVGAGQQRGADLVGRLQPALPAAGLLEQPRVLDRDAGGRGERLDDRLVVGGEVAAALLGQVEVAEDLVPDPDRDAEEGVHRRVVRREAV